MPLGVVGGAFANPRPARTRLTSGRRPAAGAASPRTGSTMAARGASPTDRMDRATLDTELTPLATFVAELRRDERFAAFVAALPTRARVSEPILPLLLAALHTELERGLLVLLPEDAE